jgi:hypothetical protein
MNTTTAQLKINGIGPLQESRSTQSTNRWHILTVTEVPKNPYGHTLKEKPPFEVLVYNHNIEKFNINQGLINEVGDFELEIAFKRNAAGPATPIFMVTDLSFKI